MRAGWTRGLAPRTAAGRPAEGRGLGPNLGAGGAPGGGHRAAGAVLQAPVARGGVGHHAAPRSPSRTHVSGARVWEGQVPNVFWSPPSRLQWKEPERHVIRFGRSHDEEPPAAGFWGRRLGRGAPGHLGGGLPIAGDWNRLSPSDAVLWGGIAPVGDTEVHAERGRPFPRALLPLKRENPAQYKVMRPFLRSSGRLRAERVQIAEPSGHWEYLSDVCYQTWNTKRFWMPNPGKIWASGKAEGK